MLQTERASAQSVPCLSEETLREFFSEFFNLTVLKDELANPRAEFIVTIYETFLRDFGFNVDNLTQPYFPAAEYLESPENYEEILSIVNLYGLMRCIAERSGIPNFSINDIFALKRKRARRILSSLATFWKFSACQLRKWFEIKLQYASVAEEKKILIEDIETKTEAFHEGKIFLEEVLSQHEELVEKCEECVFIVNKKKQEKEESTNSYYAIKQKWTDVKSDLDNVNVGISSLYARKKELEEKIVSHDQKKELEELAQKAQLYREKKEEIFCGIDEYNNLKGFHSKISNELDATFELVDNASRTATRSRDVLKEIEVLCATTKADEEEVRNLIKQQEQKRLELEAVEELMQKEEMKHLKQIEEIKKLITQEGSHLTELQKKQGTRELDVERENLLRKMKDRAAKREKFENVLISKYSSAIENLQNFIKREQENIQKMEDLLVIPYNQLEE